MKICNKCNTQQPDNFAVCSRCGAPLAQQPSNGAPMRLYMYNHEMGKKAGAMDMRKILILVFVFSGMIALLFFAAIKLTSSVSEEPSFGMVMLLTVIVVAAAIVFAVFLRSKRPKSYIAYLFYNGVLYKMIMQSGISKRPGAAANTIQSIGNMNELEQRSANTYLYLMLFEKYLSGEQLWNRATGGPIYIEPLNRFQIINTNRKFYQYSYVSSNGQVLNGRIDNAYPGIEEIFNCCH